MDSGVPRLGSNVARMKYCTTKGDWDHRPAPVESWHRNACSSQTCVIASRLSPTVNSPCRIQRREIQVLQRAQCAPVAAPARKSVEILSFTSPRQVQGRPGGGEGGHDHTPDASCMPCTRCTCVDSRAADGQARQLKGVHEPALPEPSASDRYKKRLKRDTLTARPWRRTARLSSDGAGPRLEEPMRAHRRHSNARLTHSCACAGKAS